MIYLILGNDYIWRKLIINNIVKTWPTKEVVWADQVDANWLIRYLSSANHIVVKNASAIASRIEGKLLAWRDRDMIFTDDEVESGTFKRRISRMGKRKNCTSDAPDKDAAVAAIFASLKVQAPKSAIGKMSVTQAYWTAQLSVLTKQSVDDLLKREAYPMLSVVDWNASISKFTLEELLGKISVLFAGARLIYGSQTKWRLVQEFIRIAPGEVNGAYAGATRLMESPDKIKALGKRALKISKILEDGEPPTSMVYLYGMGEG